ncbi:MAG: hypothetical protein AB7O66_05695 [Limisphaerales bacterium]
MRWFLGALLVFSVGTARAHSVWIEATPSGGLALRFAEPDGKFETSPGHLDELTVPAAFMISAEGSQVVLEAEKQRDRFEFKAGVSKQAAGAEASYLVMGPPGGPGRRPVFYARWHPWGAGPATPFLTLDIVPTGKPGEARAYLRGKPLGGVRAIWRTPDEREQELTADAEGYFRFNPTQAGIHHLRIARHREPLAGFHLGRSYDQTSHNACLTWEQK